MTDIARLKEWADDFEAAANDLIKRGALKIEGTALMTRAQQVRDEIANIERADSIEKRLAEAVSHNIELRAGFERIKAGLSRGKIGDDVVWFDSITTLWDFCDQLLNRRVPHDQSVPTTAERLQAFRDNALAFVAHMHILEAAAGNEELASIIRVNCIQPWQAALRDDETGDLWPICEVCSKPIKDEGELISDPDEGLHFHKSCVPDHHPEHKDLR